MLFFFLWISCNLWYLIKGLATMAHGTSIFMCFHIHVYVQRRFDTFAKVCSHVSLMHLLHCIPACNWLTRLISTKLKLGRLKWEGGEGHTYY